MYLICVYLRNLREQVLMILFRQSLKYAAPKELKESRNANLCYWHIAPMELAQKNNTIEFSELGPERVSALNHLGQAFRPERSAPAIYKSNPNQEGFFKSH